MLKSFKEEKQFRQSKKQLSLGKTTKTINQGKKSKLKAQMQNNKNVSSSAYMSPSSTTILEDSQYQIENHGKEKQNVFINLRQKGAQPKQQQCKYDDDEKVKLTYCGHLLRSCCLDMWLKKDSSCPICRQCFTQDNIAKWQKQLNSKLHPNSKFIQAQRQQSYRQQVPQIMYEFSSQQNTITSQQIRTLFVYQKIAKYHKKYKYSQMKVLPSCQNILSRINHSLKGDQSETSKYSQQIQKQAKTCKRVKNLATLIQQEE